MNEDNKKIRVFFSFHVPGEIASCVFSALDTMPVLWYPKENLHITLAFIGEVPKNSPTILNAIAKQAAKDIPSVQCVPISLSAENQRLRLMLAKSSALLRLHANITRALAQNALGKTGEKPYAPHITIGRLHENVINAPALPEALKTLTFSFDTFGLYQSEPGPNQLGQYTLLQSFELKTS